jgi:hypothetical protein
MAMRIKPVRVSAFQVAAFTGARRSQRSTAARASKQQNMCELFSKFHVRLLAGLGFSVLFLGESERFASAFDTLTTLPESATS